MSQPNRRDLEPLQTNDTATILVGTALWVIALIVLLIAQPGPDQRWWIWTCVAGIAGGIFGLGYVRRSARARGARRPAAAPGEQAEVTQRGQGAPDVQDASSTSSTSDTQRMTGAPDAEEAQVEEPIPPRRSGGAP
ncbi:DUF2530 domain-containing protein [Thermopolyspora sp. NPDC052614]|uniref:DUF2530 domain-containing protein n=1 Tax=Thermopolyspora sp. NPDC052614 TaxID=3155682 RepID=UPI003422B79C